MAWTPTDEDRAIATGRRFGFRLSPEVACDLLAVRGVQMQNRKLVALVSLIRHDTTNELLASLVYCDREDVVGGADEEDDGA